MNESERITHISIHRIYSHSLESDPDSYKEQKVCSSIFLVFVYATVMNNTIAHFSSLLCAPFRQLSGTIHLLRCPNCIDSIIFIILSQSFNHKVIQ